MSNLNGTRQIIYLDFNGEQTVYNGELVQLDDVSVNNSGIDAARAAELVTLLNAQFSGRDCLFVTEKPQSGEFSTIFVGKSEELSALGSNLQGISETVDKGNLNVSDNAFVLLDASAANSQLVDIIAHEAGHLLGDAHATETGTLTDFFADPGPVPSDIDYKTLENRVYMLGGAVEYTIIQNGGKLHLDRNGVQGHYLTVERDGTLYVSSSCAANNTLVNNGGILSAVGLKDKGIATINSTIINDGGSAVVNASATANNTTITSGGTLIVSSLDGSTNINGVVQHSGGALVFEHGLTEGGALANNLVNGVNVVSNFYIAAKVVNNVTSQIAWNFLLENGGKLTLNAPGAIQIWASNTIIRQDGTLHVKSGAVADTVAQEKGAAIIVEDGAIILDGKHASNTFWGTGNSYYDFLLENGGKMTLDKSTAQNTLVSSGGSLILTGTASASFTEVFESGVVSATGGSQSYTRVSSGGSLYVGDSARHDNTSVFNGGHMTMTGGSANNLNIYYGGGFTIHTNATLSNLFYDFHKTNTTISNNVASSFQLFDSQTLVVNDKHKAIDTTVSRGGALLVESGGSAYGTVVDSGGLFTMQAGGSADIVAILNGGRLDVNTRVTITNGQFSGGNGFSINGGIATGLLLQDGSILRVLDQDKAINIRLSGGTLTAGDGATLTNLTITSGALLIDTSITATGTSLGQKFSITTDRPKALLITQTVTGLHLTAGSVLKLHVQQSDTDAKRKLNAIFNNVSVGNGATLNLMPTSRFYVEEGGTSSFIQDNVFATDLTVESGGAILTDTNATITGTCYGKAFSLQNGLATNFTLANGGLLNILVGHRAYNTTISSGGVVSMAAGTEANETVIHSGGVQYVSGGDGNWYWDSKSGYVGYGGANANRNTLSGGTQVILGGSQYVNGKWIDAGGAANSTTILSGGLQVISSGGAANSTWIYDSGTQYVKTGGTVNSTVIKNNGFLLMEGSAFANSVTQEKGGAFCAYTGAIVSYGSHRLGNFSMTSTGIATNVLVENGGILRVVSKHTAEKTQVGSGGTLTVSCTGSANETTIYDSGLMEIELNGNATKINQLTGGAIVAHTLTNISGKNDLGAFSISFNSAGGFASGMLLENRGQLVVSAKTSAAQTTVRSAGHLDVYSGGKADSTTVLSSGSATISGGASATAMTIGNRGSAIIQQEAYVSGLLQQSGAALITDNRATILNGSNALGGFQIVDGVGSGLLLESGANFNVHSNGKASNTMLKEGGTQTLRFFTNAYGTIVSSGGVEYLDEGHTSGTQVYTGGAQIVTSNPFGKHYNYSAVIYNAYHSSANALATVIHSGGAQIISSGGKTMLTDIRADGIQMVDRSGHTTSTIIQSKGTQVVFRNGVASHTYISGGLQQLGGEWDFNGTTYQSAGGSAIRTFIYDGGVQDIYSGGFAEMTEIYRQGTQNVRNGGVAQNNVLDSGSVQNVYDGGIVNSTILNTSSIQNVYEGGKVERTTLNDGAKQFVQANAFVNSTTVNSNASMTISNGGKANTVVVNSNGWLQLDAGGAINGLIQNTDAAIVTNTGATITNGKRTDNIVFGITNGVASNFLLRGNAKLTVFENDTVTGDSQQILDGGELIIYTGAKANGKIFIDNGTLTVTTSKGSSKSTVTAQNLYVTIALQNIKPGNTAVVSDINALVGAAYTVNVDVNQDGGTYVLGANASKFDGTITLNVQDGQKLVFNENRFALNSSVTFNETTYTLRVDNGKLVLVIDAGQRIYNGEEIPGKQGNPWTLTEIDIANDTKVNATGKLIVGSGATANRTIVNSNGTMVLKAGGIMSGTVINKDGALILEQGAMISDTITVKGGGQITAAGSINLVNGAAVSMDISSLTSDTATKPMIVNFDNMTGVSLSLKISNTQGTGRYTLATGANAFNQIISVNGITTETLSRYKTFSIGGTRYALVLNNGELSLDITAGWEHATDYLNVNYKQMLDETDAINKRTIKQGQTQTVTGGDTKLITVQAGARQIVQSGALDTLTNVYGTQDILNGGVNASATIHADGVQNVSNGGMAVSATVDNGRQSVYSGGMVTNSWITGGNSLLTVHAGGQATAVTLNQGGKLQVNGGKIERATINSGSPLSFTSGSVMTGLTILNDAIIQGNSNVTITGSFIGSKTFSISGGVVNNLTMGSGSEFTLLNGHTARNVKLSGNAKLVLTGACKVDGLNDLNNGGIFIASTAATITNAAGGFSIQNGKAQNLVLKAQSEFTVLAGDSVQNINAAAGSTLNIVNGATVSAAAGGYVKIAGNVNFILSGIASDKAMLSIDPSLPASVSSAVFSITVDNSVTSGDYRLVSGLSKYDGSITITQNGLELGKLTVGQSIQIGNKSYSLWLSNLNNGTLTLTVNGDSRKTVKSDFNGDGKSDMLFFNEADNDVWVWLDSDSSKAQRITGTNFEQNQIIGIGDFNNDGKADVLWQCNDGTVGYWDALNPQKWNPIESIAPDAVKYSGIGDFNGNNSADILWRCNDGTIGYWSDGSSKWNPLGQTSSDWEIATIGNVTGGSKSDIVFCNKATNEVGLWLDGTSQWVNLGNSGAAWSVIGTGDFDGNGKDSLIWYNKSTNEVGLWDIDGAQATWKNLGGAAQGWTVIGVNDYNGDGKSDLVWRNYASGEIGCWTSGDPNKWHGFGATSSDYQSTINLAG